MSKTTSFVLTGLSYALSLLFLEQHNIPFAIGSCIVGVVFCSIYDTKCNRDRRIADQARSEQIRAAQTPPSVAQTSKGSHGIFVPPPLPDIRVEE